MSKEVTFYKFYTEVKNFMKDMLTDPIHAKPSEFFAENGISKTLLLKKLLERGMVVKNEDIKEISDEGGNLKSMHYVKYSIPRRDFENNMHGLYDYFFENGERKENVNENMKKVIRLTESDIMSLAVETANRILKQIVEDGGMVGGAAANGSGFMNGANNAQTSSNAQFDVPAFGGSLMRKKDPTLARKNGKKGSISIPKERV